jgi:hypothetical protein
VVEVLHLPHPELGGLLRGREHFCNTGGKYVSKTAKDSPGAQQSDTATARTAAGDCKASNHARNCCAVAPQCADARSDKLNTDRGTSITYR